jgi:hypothetical protein
MIIIEKVKPAEVNALLTHLKATGQATIDGHTITGRGIVAEYSTPGDDLQVDVIHGPWGVPKHLVEQHIRTDLTSALMMIRGGR